MLNGQLPPYRVALPLDQILQPEISAVGHDQLENAELRACDTLIFSVSGRIGSGASSVGKKLRDILQAYKYTVYILDISHLIIGYSVDPDGQKGSIKSLSGDQLKQLVREYERDTTDHRKRTRDLQDRGNHLREQFGPEILATLGAQEFIKPVFQQSGESTRIAFIVDSLKRPEEVARLRSLFGKAYFAVGVVASEAKRQERLEQKKRYSLSDFDSISERDQNERRSPNGQRSVETVLASDYFIANDYPTQRELLAETERFVSLVFRAEMRTPRDDEFGMNVAFKAAAKSACLSRQVGASIFDSSGELLSTGCNDVPKNGGGLYTSESKKDRRCWAFGGKCYNDEEKQIIVDGMVEDVSELLIELQDSKQPLFTNSEDLKAKLRESLMKSRVKQLIEFSRAVHAEMDAIMAIARTARRGLVGSTLYCTTYPCHNCAKHIVDAGVKRVVYLEPYSKSLAAKLHPDTIDDSSSTVDISDKVAFRLYNGVSPRRYAEFFEHTGEFQRKDPTGRYIDRSDNKGTLKPAIEITIEEFKTRLDRLLKPSKGVSDGSTTPD